MLSAILLLMLMSCADDSGGGGSGSGFPTIPQEDDWEWSDFGFKQVIFLSSWGVSLTSYEEPETWEFRLNGEEIDIEWELDWESREDDTWWAEVDEEDLPEGVDLSSGSTVSYYLQVNNTTSSGELTMPYQVYVEWDEFDFDENFEFDWEIQQNPNLQYVFMYFECEIDDEYYDVNKNWQLSGSKRDYSISKSLYQQYEDCDDYWLDVLLEAINFRNTGKCMAISSKGDWYESGYKRSDKKFDKKERMRKIIDAFEKDNSHKQKKEEVK